MLRAAIAVVMAAVGTATPAPAATNRCTAAATKAVVRSFVADYDAGRIAAAVRLWAPVGRFQWFSTGPPGARIGSAAYDRATLGSYLRSRVGVHERLRVTELGAGYDSRRGIVDFAGKLVRGADDLRAGTPQDFKGAADCLSGMPRLIVWSM